MGIHRPHLEERGRPIKEEEDPGVSSEEMGRRENTLVAEQVQKASHQMGGEEKELRRDDTLCVCVDNLPLSWTLGEVIFSGLALSGNTVGIVLKLKPNRRGFAVRLLLKDFLRIPLRYTFPPNYPCRRNRCQRLARQGVIDIVLGH